MRKNCLGVFLFLVLFSLYSVSPLKSSFAGSGHGLATPSTNSVVSVLFAEQILGVIRVPVSTIAEGRMIGYVLKDTIAYGDGLIYSLIVFSDVLMYPMNSALFFTLALLTALRSPVIVSLKRIALGTVLLIGQHLLMVIMDWMIENSANPATQSALKWGIGVSSIVAPLLVWLVATRIFSAGKTDV